MGDWRGGFFGIDVTSTDIHLEELKFLDELDEVRTFIGESDPTETCPAISDDRYACSMKVLRVAPGGNQLKGFLPPSMTPNYRTDLHAPTMLDSQSTMSIQQATPDLTAMMDTVDLDMFSSANAPNDILDRIFKAMINQPGGREILEEITNCPGIEQFQETRNGYAISSQVHVPSQPTDIPDYALVPSTVAQDITQNDAQTYSAQTLNDAILNLFDNASSTPLPTSCIQSYALPPISTIPAISSQEELACPLDPSTTPAASVNLPDNTQFGSCFGVDCSASITTKHQAFDPTTEEVRSNLLSTTYDPKNSPSPTRSYQQPGTSPRPVGFDGQSSWAAGLDQGVPSPPAFAGQENSPEPRIPGAQEVHLYDKGMLWEEAPNGSVSPPNKSATKKRTTTVNNADVSVKAINAPVFLLRLLQSDSPNPAVIRWEDKSAGTFKITDSKAITRKWAEARARTGCRRTAGTYEHFSRTIRHHYKKEEIVAVEGRRLTYKFGKRGPYDAVRIDK